MNKFSILALIFVVLPQLLLSQTADKTDGCIPLTVLFSAPTSTSYLWDFGDGTSSDKANPEHIFTDAGNYTIKLYTDDSASTLVGTLSVNVYPDLIVNISSNATSGCNPSTISFESNISKANEIDLSGFLWTFGDGGSSQETKPDYTYTEIGTYDVSLEVKTSFTECNKTIIKQDYISISEHEADFKIDKTSSCTIPEVFIITNISEKLDGYTYEWTIGNEVFIGYDLEPITIEEEGTHWIILKMTAPGGCEDSKSKTVRIGTPNIELLVEDTTCLEVPIQLENLSSGNSHSWDFGPGATPRQSNSRKPTVLYETAGVKTVSYSTRLSDCYSDTTFTILVSDNLASFSLGYDSLCGDTITVTMAADNPGIGSYIWNNSMDTTGPINKFIIPVPERDSFYVNELDIYSFQLEVITDFGCKDIFEDTIAIQLPEAFFVPDSVIGLAPLTIGFRDESESSDPIVSREWNFGDGTIIKDETYISHTFEEAGEYYVQMKVATANGCSDQSKGTVITVLGSIDSGGPASGECDFSDGVNYLDGSNPICVGQTVNYVAIPFRSENVHVETDEGRFNHCWMNRDGSHTFLFPGTFPVELIYETKGFELGGDSIGFFRVLGARAEIAYEKFCDDSHSVNFSSNSEEAKSLRWWHKDKVISTQEAFSYTFDELGIHEVILEAIPNEQICNSHYDTAYIYVTKPISSFHMDSLLCDKLPYLLDASSSSESIESCSNNFHWEFEGQRPLSSQSDKINHIFLPGKQEVNLAITDVNGCSSSSRFDIEVFGTEIDFPLDSSICLPHINVFEKLTTSDTTLTSWVWSFGSTIEVPEYTFTEANRGSDSIAVTLWTKDALGCIDSLVKMTRIYKPYSEIEIFNIGVCQGDPIEIKATDFREEGKYLLYNWDFNSGGISTAQNNEVIFTDTGEQPISLIIQEAGTLCYDTLYENIEVLRRPQANFSTSVDSMETICYPHTVEFQNTSLTDGQINYVWDFGNGSTSELLDPAISYERGKFNASLIAKSVWGCEDRKEISIELVGPSGDLTLDKDNICIGEEIYLELANPEDVHSYTWDLGDGSLIHDTDNLTHTYSFKPPGDKTEIDLVLKSADNGCELIKTIGLIINEVIADFEVDENYNHCSGLVGFTNLSTGANAYTWSLGDGNESSDENPKHIFENYGGEAGVKLTAIHRPSGCNSTIVKNIPITGENDFYDFANIFSPNGDGRNDLFRMVVPEKYEDVVTSTTFQVYDRWGQQVYDNDNPDGWDGTYRGQELPADVYAYYLEVEIENCKTVNEKGSVTLVR